jgi:lysylphosphatidylglycerol synthetase-like protein (DUF2156 family)
VTTIATSGTGAREQVIEFMRKYGEGSLSYSALQEGMQWFVDPELGFVQYEPTETIIHRAVVLGDPVCAEENREKLIARFLEKYPDPIFIHITKPVGKILEKLGFYINHMGMEITIDIPNFTMTGSKKEFLRSQKNRATKDGVVVAEIGAESGVSADDLRKISDEWMHRKAVHDHELQFLVRPAIFEDEFDVRKFVAIRQGKVEGFVFFDPMYRGGKVYGYMANIVRSMSDQSYSVTDFIIIEAFNKFKSEGIELLSLGFCPFFCVEDDEDLHYSKPLTAMYKHAYEHANYLYSFKSLSFHKERYRPDQPGASRLKVYSATKHVLPLITLYGVFRKMGIHPTRQSLEHAVHCAEDVAKNIPNEFKKLIQHWKHEHSHTPDPAAKPE